MQELTDGEMPGDSDGWPLVARAQVHGTARFRRRQCVEEGLKQFVRQQEPHKGVNPVKSEKVGEEIQEVGRRERWLRKRGGVEGKQLRETDRRRGWECHQE